MIPAEVSVQLDKQAIEKRIEKQLDEAIQAQLWLVSVEKISELTCMSVRFLEQHVLNDVRFRAIEIKKARKRWYDAELAFKVLKEITSEW